MAGANTITVEFNVAATNPDVRILEYSGIDPASPMDVSAGATGNSATASSGAVSSEERREVKRGDLVGRTITTRNNCGFIQRLLTNPDGDIAEDRLLTAAGSYSAGAPLDNP